MVDVVDSAEAVHEVEEIADVGDDVFAGNGAMVIGKVAVVADDLIDRAVGLFDESFDEAAAITARFGLISSKAPALIRDSTAFRFSSLASRPSTKS